VLNRLEEEGKLQVEEVMANIKDIIVKTMIAIQPELIHNYRTCQPTDREGLKCFEILGFDIILDSECKPYLLEVNHVPSFNTDTQLDYCIKKQMVSDSLSLLALSVEERNRKINSTKEFRQQLQCDNKSTYK